MNDQNTHKEDAEDRGLPGVQRQKITGGVGQKVVFAFGAILLILALVAVNGGFNFGEKEQPKEREQIKNILGAPPKPNPKIKVTEPKTTTTPKTKNIETSIQPPPPPVRKSVRREKAPPTPEERKCSASLLAFGGNENNTGNQTSADNPSGFGAGGSENADDLSASLTPTKLNGARAGIIEDPSYFITRGTFLDCALETAISSSVSGMTSCRITTDIYSTNNKVLLVERGSRITGQYQGGMRKGLTRLFVLWTRIETPNGVIIDIDSPGTDALGRSGVDGFIDTHFLERFGSAIMFSLIDDVGEYVLNEASSKDREINFDSTAETAKSASQVALEYSIDIPATLIKNQGDHVSVFVSRDLDFRGVYSLETY